MLVKSLIASDENFWIGLNDFEIEGQWRWADQSRVEFTKWAPANQTIGVMKTVHTSDQMNFGTTINALTKCSVCEVKDGARTYFYRNAIGRQNNFAQFTETNFTNLPTARAFFDWSKFDPRIFTWLQYDGNSKKCFSDATDRPNVARVWDMGWFGCANQIVCRVTGGKGWQHGVRKR